MLLRVIHPNISSIVNVTELDEEDVEQMIYTADEPQVLIYTPSGNWAFVKESITDKLFDSLIELLEG